MFVSSLTALNCFPKSVQIIFPSIRHRSVTYFDRIGFDLREGFKTPSYRKCPLGGYPGLEKTSRISEFSGGRLFEKIEWGPPLKTEKLLWVMKKTEKARIEWGGSHSILATGARRNPELRGGSHSILSKRRPLRGGSQFPFYLVKKAALVGRLPFYPGKKTKPGIS